MSRKPSDFHSVINITLISSDQRLLLKACFAYKYCPLPSCPPAVCRVVSQIAPYFIYSALHLSRALGALVKGSALYRKKGVIWDIALIRLQLNKLQCGPLFTPKYCSFLAALRLSLQQARNAV